MSRIIVISIMIILGMSIVIIGTLTFFESPALEPPPSYDTTLDEQGTKIDVTINYNSNRVILEGDEINSYIELRFPESQSNSSKVEILFYDANVDFDEKWSPRKKDVPVSLKFDQFNFRNDVKWSKYIAKPTLSYSFPGTYDAQITIENEVTPFTKTLGKIIEIKSLDKYNIEKNNKNLQGLTLLILGVTIISLIPAILQLMKLWNKFRRIEYE